MTSVPWSTILAAASHAADLLPPPLNIAADLALAIARGYLEEGCTIDGCPYEVAAKLEPADIPTGQAGLDARSRAVARAAGLDPATIRARLDADEL